jgi:hypothetical protein
VVVLIINLTDAPGHPKGPTQIDIYNKTLSPGEQLKLPADLVDKRVRSLAEGENPVIAIGNLPPWYVAAKKKKGRPLTPEERQSMQVAPPPPVIQMKPLKEKDKEKEPSKSAVDLGEDIGRKQTKG